MPDPFGERLLQATSILPSFMLVITVIWRLHIMLCSIFSNKVWLRWIKICLELSAFQAIEFVKFVIRFWMVKYLASTKL